MTTLAALLNPEKALIFRITHRENLPHLLEHGIHCRNSQQVNPQFVEIGNPSIIDRRKTIAVGVPPGGKLADYVPFYFTPCTPMLYNILTGHNGLRKRTRSEIVILVSSLDRLEQTDIDYVISDRNASLATASLSAGRGALHELPWDAWRAKDFKRDPDDPAKMERYQAETLVHKILPPVALGGIITYDRVTQATVAEAVATAQLATPVRVHSSWYPG
jgi:hypothetical protein